MIDVAIDDFEFGDLMAYNGDTFATPYAPIDVVRGAVTVYRPSLPGTRLRSLMDHASAALQVLALLDDGVTPLGLSAAGPMRKSALYRLLDGGEKGAASYRIGTGMAHLCAQDLLHIDQLAHFDRLWRSGLATLVSGKSRPDMIGLDDFDNWAVVEAKGRSDRLSGLKKDDVLASAKRQVENVDRVGLPLTVVPPLWRIVALTELDENPIKVTFVDPPASEDYEPVVIQIDPTQLSRGYYSLVDEAAEYTGPVQPLPGFPDVLGARLPGSNVWIGLTEPVRNALRGRTWGFERDSRQRAPIRNRGGLRLKAPMLKAGERALARTASWCISPSDRTYGPMTGRSFLAGSLERDPAA